MSVRRRQGLAIVARVQAACAVLACSFGNRRFAALLLSSALSAAAIVATQPALAGQSLLQAMTRAYESNPRLDAERARVRAVDEQVPEARAGWAPTVSANASYGHETTRTRPAVGATGHNRAMSYGVSVSQSIFDGFRTRTAVSVAEARVRAARARLRRIEADVLSAAVTAYMDVVRDRQLLHLNERNVAALARELRAARARRAVKEVTITDVAQAEARHARAISARDEAEANLMASEAEYRRIVGADADGVRMPPIKLRLVPRARDDAITFALGESPDLHLAHYEELAARHGVDQAASELMPDVRLEAQYQREYDTLGDINRQDDASITGRLTVPLFSGGAVRARVRAAKHTHVGRIQDLEDVRRQVVARVTAAWSRLEAGQARIASDQVQVRAARTALDGVRAEQEVGQRTLLDLLNAEQELLEAQSALVRSRRDTVVAQYNLLSAIGRLDASLLSLPTGIYDPRDHYNAAKDKWLSISIAQPMPVDPVVAEEARARDAWQLRPTHAARIASGPARDGHDDAAHDAADDDAADDPGTADTERADNAAHRQRFRPTVPDVGAYHAPMTFPGDPPVHASPAAPQRAPRMRPSRHGTRLRARTYH